MVWIMKATFAIRWMMKINRAKLQLLLYLSLVLVVQKFGCPYLEILELLYSHLVAPSACLERNCAPYREASLKCLCYDLERKAN